MPDPSSTRIATTPRSSSRVGLLVISWLWVGIPLAWGVWQTLRTSLSLFRA